MVLAEIVTGENVLADLLFLAALILALVLTAYGAMQHSLSLALSGAVLACLAAAWWVG